MNATFRFGWVFHSVFPSSCWITWITWFISTLRLINFTIPKLPAHPGCWWHGKKRVHYFFWQVVIVFVGTHTLLSQGEKHHLKVKEILRFLTQLMRESRMSLGANFQVFVLVKLLTSTSTLRIHTWSFAFRKCSSSAVFGNISIAIN